MLNLPFTRAQMPACFSSSVEAGGMSKTPARGKADCHVWATRRPLRPFTDADPPTRVENPLLGARGLAVTTAPRSSFFLRAAPFHPRRLLQVMSLINSSPETTVLSRNQTR